MPDMTTWHEERRQDRLTSAQIEREREAARAKDRIAHAQAQGEERQSLDYAPPSDGFSLHPEQ